MPNLGIKTFWKNVTGSPSDQGPNQILKNECYINIKLQCVNYKSEGTWWQKRFGGTDNIVLTTTLNYKAGPETIEATSVQNRKKIKINQSSNLAVNKIIGEKIPSTADSIALEVKMSALKNDKLQERFDMLNKTEYQTALQLAPKALGQVLTITSLVKNLLTDSDLQPQIEASYAGIISSGRETEPIVNGNLTRGMLIFIATDEENSYSKVNVNNFELKGLNLYYNNNEVTNTYSVFIISTDDLRGSDQNSNWFKKYAIAVRTLDKIRQANNPTEKENILKDAIAIWNEGNILLDADTNYLDKEKTQIRNLYINEINDTYKKLNPPPVPPIGVLPNVPLPLSPDSPGISLDIIKGLTGSTTFNTIREALPATGNYLLETLKLDSTNTIESGLLENIVIDPQKLSEFINKDNKAYLLNLDKSGITRDFLELDKKTQKE
jgi:hypothetical protein